VLPILAKILQRPPALAIHGAMLAVSAAAHAAILVAVVGHPRAAAAVTVDDRAAEVDVAIDRPPESPSDGESKREPAVSTAAPRTHTHPYPVPASHDWTPHDPALVHVLAPPSSPAPHDDPTATPSSSPAAPALATEALPHFTIAVTPGASAVGATEGHAGMSPGDPDGDGTPAAEQSVSSPARLLGGAPPAYPAAARSLGVEADVPLELVVSRAGAVESARVMAHAGFGFDESALEAIRGYRFSPAVRDGRPTRVRMRWTMHFRLR
jgi:TonB family protein